MSLAIRTGRRACAEHFRRSFPETGVKLGLFQVAVQRRVSAGLRCNPVSSGWRETICQTRTFCTETSSNTADELQALASKIVQDRAFAEKLLQAEAAPKLIAAAEKLAPGTKDKKHSIDSTSEPTEPIEAAPLISQAPLPSARQMKIYALHHFVPFIGFGFFDNFIMILAGDYIDASLGITLGISTMAAAAIGNTISDVIGLWTTGVIETMAAAMGVPASGLTPEQRSDIRIRILRNTSMVCGIVVGCVLGMAPLVYPSEYRLWPSREQKEEHLNDGLDDDENYELRTF